MVNALLKRRGGITNERSHGELLSKDEWWLIDLARELKTSREKLQEWANRGWVHGRRTPVQRCWILWADNDEIRRLRELIDRSKPGKNRRASDLKAQKKRPALISVSYV